MKIIWDFIADKLGGIPSDIIFYEDVCLPFTGWRWAPQSLLYGYDRESQITADEKISRQETNNLAWHTPLGLEVLYPIFRMTSNYFDDGLAHSLWEGNIFLSGTRTLFQDDAGKWFQIMDSYRQ